MMADGGSSVHDSSGKPVKSILKTGARKTSKPTFGPETGSEQDQGSSGIHWDEMNILMTEHPADKDYGHMKIEEPKTPYHEMIGDDEEGEGSSAGNVVSPDDLASKVREAAAQEEASGPSKWERESASGSEGEDSLTDEQQKHKEEFREWRKKHYNEYFAVKRARELIAKDLAEAELEDSPGPGCPVEISVSTADQDTSMQSVDDSETMQQDSSH